MHFGIGKAQDAVAGQQHRVAGGKFDAAQVDQLDRPARHRRSQDRAVGLRLGMSHCALRERRGDHRHHRMIGVEPLDPVSSDPPKQTVADADIVQHVAFDCGCDQGAAHLRQPGIFATARRQCAICVEQGQFERTGEGPGARGAARAEHRLDRQSRGNRTAMVSAHPVSENRQRGPASIGQGDRAKAQRILLLVAPTDDLARSGQCERVHARSAGQPGDHPQSQDSPHSGTKRSAVEPTRISAWLSSGTGESSGEPDR